MQCLQKSQITGTAPEREVRGKYEMYLRTSPMARGPCSSKCITGTEVPAQDVSDPLFLTLFPRPMQKMAVNAGLLGASQVIFCSIC